MWEDASPGDKILHGQWSTPAVGTIGGVVQVVHGQGDGWVRGYEAKTGKKLWEFDTQSEGLRLAEDAQRGDRDAGDRTTTSSTSPTGRIPNTAKASATSTRSTPPSAATSRRSGRLWHYDKIRRSISTASIKDGLIYYPDFSGFLHCLDVKTGQAVWMHDMFAAMWSSTMVADGKVYLGDEDGDVVVIAGRAARRKILAENNMGSSVYSTVVTANGVMFIMTRNKLFAIQEGAQLRK